MTGIQMMQAAQALKTASAVINATAALVSGGSLPADMDSVAAHIAPQVRGAVVGMPFVQGASERTINVFARFLGSIVLDMAAATQRAAS